MCNFGTILVYNTIDTWVVWRLTFTVWQGSGFLTTFTPLYSINPFYIKRESGFNHVSIDRMMAVPFQSTLCPASYNYEGMDIIIIISIFIIVGQYSI